MTVSPSRPLTPGHLCQACKRWGAKQTLGAVFWGNTALVGLLPLAARGLRAGGAGLRPLW
jgi:hypothetical protein